MKQNKKNLVEAFENDNNNKLEINKYGRLFKGKKIPKKIIISFIIIIIILIFIIYWIYSENKNLKRMLTKINSEKKQIKINLDSKEKLLNDIIKNYSLIEIKNNEILIGNNYTISYLKEKIKSIEEEKKKYSEKIFFLEEQNRDISTKLIEEKGKKEDLNIEIEKYKEYIKKIEGEFPFMNRDKNNKSPHILECNMPEEMKNSVINIAINAINYYEGPQDMADYMIITFEKMYIELHYNWNCIIGLDFSNINIYKNH